MAIRADLRTYLLSQSSITSLIGQRISLSRVPLNLDATAGQSGGPFPCVTYRRVSAGAYQDMDNGAGYCEADFEFDFYSTDSVEVESVSEAFRLKLQGYRGAMGGSTVKKVTLVNEQDFFHPPPDGSDTGIHRTTQQYNVGFYVTIPTYS